MINEWLYKRLQRVFGKVSIANEGTPLIVTEFIDPITGKKKVHIDQRGETYCVNCPFCEILTNGRSDTKQRLWINHCYGVSGHSTGRRFWGLAHCYNEDCLSVEEFREALKSIVYGFETPPKNVRQLKHVPIDYPAYEVELPTGLVPINSLPSSHPASQFLESRGFDRNYLYEVFKIQYAEEIDVRYPMMHNRIIIPVYVKGKLVGFQGRSVREGEIKYLTAKKTRISEALYGYDVFPRDGKAKIVFLVEGAPDVWRIGPGALGMCGTHLSHSKVQLIEDLGVDFVFVIFDGDIATNPHGMSLVNSVKFKLEKQGIPHIIRILPDGKDPADFSKEELYDFIIKEVRYFVGG